MKKTKLRFSKALLREYKKRLGMTSSIAIKKVIDMIGKMKHYNQKEALSCKYSIYKNIYKQALLQRGSLYKKMKLEKR